MLLLDEMQQGMAFYSGRLCFERDGAGCEREREREKEISRERERFVFLFQPLKSFFSPSQTTHILFFTPVYLGIKW